MKPGLTRLFILLAFAPAPALAQQPATVIAIPPLTTPDNREQRAGSPAAVAWQASQLIASDLRSATDVLPLGPDQKDFYSYPEVTAPSFQKWRAAGAKSLLTGFVRAQSDGRLAFGCYVYDVTTGREIGRKGFAVMASEWRRAAHKCADLAYARSTGAAGGLFDARIAYVAEGGSGDSRTKRIAVMDVDGFNHKYLTAGDTTVLTPRLSPDGESVAFVSFAGGRPAIRLSDLLSGEQRPLLPIDSTSFAPRYSPDGKSILFSMTVGPNTDIYRTGANGGAAQRLTTSPGIDTSASFSPDGKRIAFESDRSGSQQIYVMNSDGSGQRRISFGGARYASPEWSPDGEWIAFTRRGPDGLRIGVMKADGSQERLVTAGPSDEGASWSASGRMLAFQRTDASGRSSVYRVSVAGGEPARITTPQDASDPDWSAPLD